MGEEVKARKFRILGITEEAFEKLPVEERLSRLVDIKEVEEIAISERRDEEEEARQREREVERLLSETASRQLELAEKLTRIERLWRDYHAAVHDQRVEIGRLAGYTRWYNVAEKRLDTIKMRYYGIKIGVQREKLSLLKEKVAVVRAKFGTLTRLRKIERQVHHNIDVVRGRVESYTNRIMYLDHEIGFIQFGINRLFQLIEEIDSEIAELEVTPKAVRHRYREVSFEILNSAELKSKRTGSDIDIEILVDGYFKSLPPTRYEGNEDAWLDEIEVVFRNSICQVIDDCQDSEYFMIPRPGTPVGVSEALCRCNVVDIRIIKKTIIDVSKYYGAIEPPVTLNELSTYLRKELEKHTRLSITQVTFMRSNDIGAEKSRNSTAERAILPCVEKYAGDVVEELIEFSTTEELEELMRFLSEE